MKTILMLLLISLIFVMASCTEQHIRTKEEIIKEDYMQVSYVSDELAEYKPYESNGAYIFLANESVGVDCKSNISFLVNSNVNSNSAEPYVDILTVFNKQWFIRKDLLSLVSKDDVKNHFKSCLLAITNRLDILSRKEKAINKDSWK